MKKQRPILSISMLASNRMDTLPRCLESLTPIREAIPSELIIVDTSQNPAVHEVVVKYADKVCTFEWCNDFAKARNAGLKMAEGEWFMFIDDDEWFAEPEELIEFFASGEYKKYGYAQHRIKNFQDLECKRYAYGWVARLTKLWPDTAFHSRVHEYLAPLKGESKTLSATSYHTGYAYKTAEESKAHFERNVTLLKAMEEEEPDELRWKIQMLQEYITIDDWIGMADYGKKVLDSLWAKPGKINARQFATIHIAYAIALNESEQYELVEAVYEKAKDVVKDLIAAKAYMELCVAQSNWALEQYEQARIHIQRYLEGYEIYCKEPSKCSNELLGIFLSDTFQDNRVAKAYSILLSSELRTGHRERLYSLYPKLMWDKGNINSYCNVEAEIIDVLMQNQDYKMMEIVLRDALSSLFICQKIMKAIVAWEEKDNALFIRMLEAIKTIDVQDWYKEYAHLLTLEESSTKEEVLKNAVKFITLVPNIFSIPTEIVKVLEKHEIKVADLYVYIDFKTWKKALERHLEEIQMNQVEELRVLLEDSVMVNDIRYYYFMMILMEQKVLLAQKENLSFDELTDLLVMFSDYTCLGYEDMYGEHLQVIEVENWPKKYQAAKWLQIFFSEVGDDISSAIGYLAKVVAVYPCLSNALQYYIERIQCEILNG